jgi:hypothetical protein
MPVIRLGIGEPIWDRNDIERSTIPETEHGTTSRFSDSNNRKRCFGPALSGRIAPAFSREESHCWNRRSEWVTDLRSQTLIFALYFSHSYEGRRTMSGMRKRIVAITIFLATLLMAVGAAEESTGDLWSKFQQTRQSERTLHQVFDVTEQDAAGAIYRQALWHYRISVDLSQGKWRQQFVGLEGNRTEIFDGQDLTSCSRGRRITFGRRGTKRIRNCPSRMTINSIGRKPRSCNSCPVALRRTITPA